MRTTKPKLTVFLLILVLAVPLFLVPSGAAPAVSASQGDVTTAGDAVASKIHSKLQAAVVDAAASDVFDVIVYAAPGTDLSKYMSNLLVRKYVLPNGTQTYFGRATSAQVGKLASLPGVAAIQDMRYTGDTPEIPELGAKHLAGAGDLSKARERIAALKARAGQGTAKASAAPEGIDDWFDVRRRP